MRTKSKLLAKTNLVFYGIASKQERRNIPASNIITRYLKEGYSKCTIQYSHNTCVGPDIIPIEKS